METISEYGKILLFSYYTLLVVIFTDKYIPSSGSRGRGPVKNDGRHAMPQVLLVIGPPSDKFLDPLLILVADPREGPGGPRPPYHC